MAWGGRSPYPEAAGHVRLCGRVWRKYGCGREEQTEEKAECRAGVSVAECMWGRGRPCVRRGGRAMAEFVASVCREKLGGGVGGHPAGDYLVGQVAGSLAQGRRPSGGGAARLAALFSSAEPQVQPVYVPVSKVSHWVRPERTATWGWRMGLSATLFDSSPLRCSFGEMSE